MSLKTKILAVLLTMSIGPLVVLGAISVDNSGQALSSLAFSQLKSMREVKKHQIEMLFEENKNNFGVLIETVSSLQQSGFDKLAGAQENKKAQIEGFFKRCLSDIEVIAKDYTIRRALIDFGSTLDREEGLDTGLYDFFENVKYSGSLKLFRQESGYYDLLLIDRSGKVVYGSNREADLGVDLRADPRPLKELAKCFEVGLKQTNIQDFTEYEPAGGLSIAFVGSPIANRKGETIGVVVLKITAHPLNTIVQRRQRMGKTGETYLVGRHRGIYRLRSDLRIKTGRIGESVLDQNLMEPLTAPLGPMVKVGSSSALEIAKYDPLDIPGLDWAIVTTMSLEEVIAPELGGALDYFEKYLVKTGFDDLLLISPNGHVFYSARRGADYNINVLHGPHSTTGLGLLVNRVLTAKDFQFVDFSPYPAAEGRPMAFVGQPLIRNGRLDLVVALRMSLRELNEIMLKRDGMGQTGETYLVGPDQLLRSDSFPAPEEFSVTASFADPDRKRIRTRAVEAALAGQTGEEIIEDYRGVEVLSAYTRIRIGETNWALIAEMDAEEALAGLQRFTFSAILVAVVTIGFMVFLALIITRHITKPVGRLTEAARRLKDRDFEARVEVGSNDELELLGEAFNSMAEEVSDYSRSLEQKVNQLKAAEVELKQKEGQLRQLADAALEGILIHERGKLVQANNQFYAIFGLEPESLTGEQVFDRLVGEESRQAFREGVSNESSGTFEVLGRRADGEEFPMVVRVRSMDYEGRRVTVTAIRDISDWHKNLEERRSLENQLRQAQKMESLGTLAGGIAHDFNNILAAIVGYSELAITAEKEGQSNLELIQEVIGAGMKAKDLVTQILTFSRKVEPELRPVDLNREVIQTEKMLQRTIPKMIGIKLLLAAKPWLTNADTGQLSQVIMNLATNAKDAMPDGGELVIETANVTLDEKFTKTNPGSKPGDYVLLTVSDTGHGIDPEAQQNIFDPFYTDKEVGQGTGLGLATVYGIVKNHGGYIVCRSELGQGASFRVYLPAIRSAAMSEEGAPVDDENIRGGDERILLVDDEKAIRALGRRMLADQGYRVVLAETGEEALDIYRPDPSAIDLVILDISMPGMGGTKCLEEILEINPTARVLIASGYSKDSRINEIINAGEAEFIPKPYAQTDLLKAVRQVLDKDR